MTDIAQPGEYAPRLEDERFLRGEGNYTDDADSDGQLFLGVVRSQHAHARIVAVDANDALAVDGVLAVYTDTDLAADGLGVMPCESALPDLKHTPRYALVREVARHVGDPIAFVVATNPQAALDGAEQVFVDAEPLAAAVGSRQALQPNAPQVWPEVPGNLAFDAHFGDEHATDAAIAKAAHVVALQFHNTRVSAAPLEPRAAIGEYDSATETYTLTGTIQGVHGVRSQLATSVFNVEPDKICVRADDVGGGFGLKNFLYPEWILLLWAAKRHGAPIRWVGERGEDFSASAHGRDMQVDAALALSEDGDFLALKIGAIGDMGAYLSGNGPNIATKSFLTAIGGVYNVPNVHVHSRGAYTNTGCVDAYRGAGKPEANFLIERLIDLAAARTGLDRIELRKRNILKSFPHQSALGISIEGGRFGANLELALESLDGFAERRASSESRGLLRGAGLSCFLETARGATSEGAEIRFLVDGSVEARVGTESNGQGHETAFTQLVSHRLNLPISKIRYVQADTSLTRIGFGHGGARTMHMGGTTLTWAIDAALEKGRTVAAQLLQTGEDTLRFADGHFVCDSSGQSVALAQVADAAREMPHDFGLKPGGLDSYAQRDDAPITFPNGCHIAEVEVDPDTGAVEICGYRAVDDYGKLINPVLTEGQVQGGVTQGIGQALGEIVAYESDSGQLFSGSFMDYYMPRADAMPTFDVRFEGEPTEANPLGVKGSGQAGAIVSTQVIVNAVVDALRARGVEHLEMPLTPEKVWRAANGQVALSRA